MNGTGEDPELDPFGVGKLQLNAVTTGHDDPSSKLPDVLYTMYTTPVSMAIDLTYEKSRLVTLSTCI
jgi:hypothetical protein